MNKIELTLRLIRLGFKNYKLASSFKKDNTADEIDRLRVSGKVADSLKNSYKLDLIDRLIKVARIDPKLAASLINIHKLSSGFIVEEEIDRYVKLAKLVKGYAPEFACGAFHWHLARRKDKNKGNPQHDRLVADMLYELVEKYLAEGNVDYAGYSWALIKYGFPDSAWWTTLLDKYFHFCKNCKFEDKVDMREAERGEKLALIAINSDMLPDLQNEAIKEFKLWAKSKLSDDLTKSDIGWHMHSLLESYSMAMGDPPYKSARNVELPDNKPYLIFEMVNDIYWLYADSFLSKKSPVVLKVLFYGITGGDSRIAALAGEKLIGTFNWLATKDLDATENELYTLRSMSLMTYSRAGRQEFIKSLFDTWQELLNEFNPEGIERRSLKLKEIRMRPH